jgi:hypothetical protein
MWDPQYLKPYRLPQPITWIFSHLLLTILNFEYILLMLFLCYLSLVSLSRLQAVDDGMTSKCIRTGRRNRRTWLKAAAVLLFPPKIRYDWRLHRKCTPRPQLAWKFGYNILLVSKWWSYIFMPSFCVSSPMLAVEPWPLCNISLLMTVFWNTLILSQGLRDTKQ